MLKMPLKKSSFALVSKKFRMVFNGDQSVRHVTHPLKQYFDIRGRLFNSIYYFIINIIRIIYIFPISVLVRVSKLE